MDAIVDFAIVVKGGGAGGNKNFSISTQMESKNLV